MKESKTTYAYLIEHMKDPSFLKVRDIACDFVQKLPSELVDELHESLNRGVNVLDSEPLLQMYFYSFGKMHSAKLCYAFNHMNDYIKNATEIEIIDYGCGQGLASICYHDFINDYNPEQIIRSITLIEPSVQALSRAELLCSVFFPETKIIAINKSFNDLTKDDYNLSKDIPTLHLFSNIIDVETFDIIPLANIVKNISQGDNEYIIVSPMQSSKRMQRLEQFAKEIEVNCYYKKYLDKQQLEEDKDWTCATLLCSTRNNKFATLNIDEIYKKIEKLSEDSMLKVDQSFCKELFDEVKLGAEYGDAKCQNNLGRFFQFGIGTQKDYTQAYYWYNLAYEQGYISAFCNLARLYIYGKGVKKNITYALEILDKVKDKECDSVFLLLGEIYRLENKHDLAIENYKRAIDLGNSKAKFIYATYLLDGLHCKKNIKQGIKLLKESAKEKNAQANFCLAKYYENGDDEGGIKQSPKKAIECYKIAANKGHSKSQLRLAEIYKEGILNVSKNLKESFKWYKLLAEKRDESGCFYVAYYYSNGIGVDKNIEEAVKWYIIAAELGSISAMNNLAICYQNGKGVDKDFSKAFELFKKSADNGNITAANNLSICYENGLGTTKSLEKAFYWKQKVAESGNVKAQEILSKWFFRGYGTYRSRELALYWYVKSRVNGDENNIINNIEQAIEYINKKNKKGEALFQYLLAKCYDYGVGVQINQKEAFRLYKLSANKGFAESLIKLHKTSLLKTDVTQEELDNSNKDEYGVIYSSDWKKILKCSYTTCKKYKIRKGTRIIANEAFVNQSLSEIIIPSSVILIGENPFYRDSNYNGKELNIVNYSFNYKVKDKALYSKDEELLVSCWSEKELFEIPESVKCIGAKAFKSNDSIKQIIFPNSIGSIGEKAFYECYNLKSLDLPTSIKQIGVKAFYGCENLENIWSLGSISTLEDSTFCGCNLKYIHLPSTLKIIKEEVFSSNLKLSNIDLPDSVTEIGKAAFAYCYEFERINLGENVKTIGDFCFWNCKIKEVRLPSSLVYLGIRPFYEVEKIIIKEGGQYINLDNMIINTNTDTLVMHYGESKSITVKNVKSINPYAFFNSNIQEVSIKGDLKEIGEFAFFNASELRIVDLPSEIQFIRTGAFAQCESLKSIKIPRFVKELEKGCFSTCISLKKIIIEGESTKATEDIIEPQEYTQIPHEYESNNMAMGSFISESEIYNHPSIDSLESIVIYIPKNSIFNYKFNPVYKYSWKSGSMGRKFDIVRYDNKSKDIFN